MNEHTEQAVESGEREKAMLMDELRAELPGRTRAVAQSANRVAQEIVSVLEPELVTRTEEFPDRIQFRIAKRETSELRRVILARESLERLDHDPHRDVKIEYLRRELASVAGTRRTWAYPRTLWVR